MGFSKETLFAAAVLAVLGQGFFGASRARASNLDDGFLKGGAAPIRNYLQKQGYKNVGILRFEVKKGRAMPSMNVGKMNSLVATRLENALIHVNDLARPIGITRGAGLVAAEKDKNANWHTAAGRESLFRHSYPLAWGDTEVLVDAFLTGTVEISPDFKETKVTVKVFDKKNTEMRVVGTPLTVKTDRDALREMGEGFVIAKRSLNMLATKGAVPEAEVDAVIAAQVEKTAGIDNRKNLREYLDFQIVVDGTAAEIRTEGDLAFIDTPLADQKLIIKLNAKEKLGLLLKVNGVNTLNYERDERDRMESSWWVLEPGKDYTIHGFYISDKSMKGDKLRRFKLVDEADADRSELGDNQAHHGVISFEVFKTGSRGAGEPRIVSRKTSNIAKFKERGASLKSLQDHIKATMNIGLSKRDPIIVPGSEEAASLESTEFEGVWVGACDVYYRPK